VVWYRDNRWWWEPLKGGPAAVGSPGCSAGPAPAAR